MNITEKDLIENGFTVKEVARLNNIIKKGTELGEKETLYTMIVDLKKRFKMNVFFITTIAFLLLISIDTSDRIEVISYIITFVATILGISLINPIILSTKAWLFSRKKGI